MKHTMIYEGKGRRGKVKKSTKRPARSTRFGKLKRQAWNVLGFIGLMSVVVGLVYLIVGGG